MDHATAILILLFQDRDIIVKKQLKSESHGGMIIAIMTN